MYAKKFCSKENTKLIQEKSANPILSQSFFLAFKIGQVITTLSYAVLVTTANHQDTVKNGHFSLCKIKSL